MGLEGLKSRNSGIWNQDIVMALLGLQRYCFDASKVFFFNSRYNSKRFRFGLFKKKNIYKTKTTWFWSPLQEKKALGLLCTVRR